MPQNQDMPQPRRSLPVAPLARLLGCLLTCSVTQLAPAQTLHPEPAAVAPPSGGYRAPARHAFPRTAIQLDPLNLFVFGRLNTTFTLELTPRTTLFVRGGWVISETPPGYNFSDRPRTVRVASAGLGPLATWASGGTYWFGQPFDSLGLSAYYEAGYFRVSAVDSVGVIDETYVPTSRVMIGGTVSRSYGHFVIGAEVALGVELRSVDRCPANAQCPPGGGHFLSDDRSGTVINLDGPFEPFALALAFNLGLQF